MRRLSRTLVIAASLATLSAPLLTASPASAAVPGAPTITGVTAGNQALAVSWAPADSSATSFVARLIGDPTHSCTASTGDFPPNTCTITGLTNGQLYGVEVSANGGGGASSFTQSPASISQMPTEDPNIPADIIVRADNSQVLVSWTAPTPNTGNATYAVAHYRVAALDATTGEATGSICTTSSTSCVVGDLTNGTAYRFAVTAMNQDGWYGLPGYSGSITPANVPTSQPYLAGPPVVPGDSQATVQFSTTSADTATTSFVVVASPGGQTCTAPRVGTALASCVVTGLTNGDSYTFTVAPANGAGVGTLASVTTPSYTLGLTTPGAVGNVVATPGDGSIQVSWSAPTTDGGTPITSYQAIATPGIHLCTATPPVTSCIISGLLNSSAYQVSAYGINAVGSGTIVDAVGTTTPLVAATTTPDVPTSVTATAAPGTATVHWTAPALAGGSTISGYTVTSSPDGVTCTSSTTSCTFAPASLTNGTAYTFSVTATNGVGASDASLPSTAVTPLAVPSAPTGVTAAAGNGAIKVTWTDPTDNGGSQITGYTATTTATPHLSCSVTGASGSTSCLIPGVANAVTTTVTVVATNVVGDSAASSPSSSVTTSLVPLTPAWATASAGDGQVMIRFATSSDGHGNAATSYVASVIGDSSKTCTYVPVYPNSDECLITGLTNGTQYSFSLAAVNGVGRSLPVIPAPIPGGEQSMVATPSASLDAPRQVAGTSQDGQAAIYFKGIPNDAAITYGVFVATYPNIPDPVGDPSLEPACQFSRSGSDSYECTAQGLDNGTLYNVVVMATNGVLTSSVSAPTAVFPYSTPSSASGLSVTTGASTAVVTWTAGADGGYPITSTTVVAEPGGATCTATGSATSCSFTGLSPMTTYTFSVTPRTAIGAATAATTDAEVGSFGRSGAGFVAEVMYGGYQWSTNNGATWSAPQDLGLGVTDNALAYEPSDGFMYFLDNHRGQRALVYRLSVTGQTESLGTVAGLPRRVIYTGGAIDPATGDYYVNSGSNLYQITGSGGSLSATRVAVPSGTAIGSDFVIHGGKIITFVRSSICTWTITDSSTPATCWSVPSSFSAPYSGSQWLSPDGGTLYVRQNVNALVLRLSGLGTGSLVAKTIGIRDGSPSNPVGNDGASVVPAVGSPTLF